MLARGSNLERVDVAALTTPLVLAAREEKTQAALHGRDDLSGVYEYMAYLADGQVRRG